MKIVFLGTSHGDATATRNHSATLIETAGRMYLVDAGEPVSATLIRRGIVPARISASFITHLHCDHCGGLPTLAAQARKYRNRYPEIVPAYLLPTEDGVGAFRHWLETIDRSDDPELRAARAYGPGVIYDDGHLAVTAHPNRHIPPANTGEPRSFSFRIEAEGRTLFFTGDLSGEEHYGDFDLAAADRCDLVCSELTHFAPENALSILEKLSTGQLIFHHLHDPWQTAEGAARIRALCGGLPYPVSLAYDGMEIQL